MSQTLASSQFSHTMGERGWLSRRQEAQVAGKVYKLIDIVGTSNVGVSEAIQAAVNRASQTLKGLDWFQVSEIRGTIEDGRVGEYQVAVKIGFRVLSDEELRS
jgi:dodecin